MRIAAGIAAVAVFLACSESKAAGPKPGPVPKKVASQVRLERVARNLARPVDLQVAPGDRSGRLFVVEQRGTIRILRGGKVEKRPFLDIRKLVSRDHEERGLLGLAFHPRYAETGRFYVNYTDRRGHTRVVEYRVDPKDADRADPQSARVVFKLRQPYANHNGGDLAFGPDGKLYIGTGDGGAAGDPERAGQDRKQLLAKMLRLDVDAAKPRPEIAAIGLRNPWRYAFDAKTGDLYIADVGQNEWEEVHVVAAGQLASKNFGWSVLEGSHCYRERGCKAPGMQRPAIEYDHRTGCSITGGEVYRGKALPALRGVYFYADYCTAILRSFRWSEAGGARDHWDWKPVLDPKFRLANISSFGVDADGEIYILSLGGDIYKIVPRAGGKR